MLVDKVK